MKFFQTLCWAAIVLSFPLTSMAMQEEAVEENTAKPALSESKENETTPTQNQRTFAGTWETTYGTMELSIHEDQVSGNYGLGTIIGTINDNQITFHYREPDASGEGKFFLSRDGKSFRGRWRQDGNPLWLPWTGKRVVEEPLGFSGLWQTSYGAMRLMQDGDEIIGTYMGGGQESKISGTIKENRFVFRYVESQVEGTGWFELSKDLQSIAGKWRPDGVKRWSRWSGNRIKPKKNKNWLIILEADWEAGIAEPEYSFADMLEHYFKMSLARHIDVRKRSFHDGKDLVKFCREIKYLAEPVVLLISTHGTPQGIAVGGEIIGAKKLATALAGANNLKLLHLSGCAMMAGDYPKQIHSILKQGRQQTVFPISGYKTYVAWDASAIGDFTFLSMLLIHRLDPENAVRQSILVSPYLGTKRVAGARYRPLGLSVAEPKNDKSLAAFDAAEATVTADQ